MVKAGRRQDGVSKRDAEPEKPGARIFSPPALIRAVSENPKSGAPKLPRQKEE
jgi:hypothetical protein